MGPSGNAKKSESIRNKSSPNPNKSNMKDPPNNTVTATSSPSDVSTLSRVSFASPASTSAAFTQNEDASPRENDGGNPTDVDDVAAEEEQEVGDTDSVDSAEEMDILDSAREHADEQRNLCHFLGDCCDCPEDGMETMKKWTGDLPQAPKTWKPDPPKIECGEIPFDKLDNPGGWDKFHFRPKFHGEKTKKCLHHCLPTGCTPVPIDRKSGERELKGWEFFCKGWKPAVSSAVAPPRTRATSDFCGLPTGRVDLTEAPEEPCRLGATPANLFPSERKGRLDCDLLLKMGLNEERLLENDALFFHQSLRPICDQKKSGMDDDPRMPHHSQVENWSSKHASGIGMCGSHGHKCEPINISNLLKFDMVPSNLDALATWMVTFTEGGSQPILLSVLTQPRP